MSTSCASVDFSSDSTQIAVGMYWYQTDGATAYVYQVDTGSQVDSVSGPRPGNCQSGNNNNCGSIYGISWSPDSTRIVTAHGRNDEGVYYWFADIDEDNDGYNTTDQGDGIVDAFPSEGTQWDDSDGDLGTAIILHQLSNLTNAPTTGATALKIDLDALIPMAMAGPTSTTGLQATKSNGSMQITMDMATIISTNSTRINFTSTNVVMRFQMMQRNGTTRMATAMVTTTKMLHGINIEVQHGQVKSLLVRKTSTSSHSIEHSGEIPMAIGLATNR